MKKTIFANEVVINAPIKKVWAALADFGNVYKMSNGVKSSHLTSKQKTGVGTTRHCDLVNMGAEVEEKITEWTQEKSISIDIYKTKKLPLVTNLKGHFTLEKQGTNTKVVGIFEYSMKNFIGDILNSLMMKRMNKKGWTGFLAGLKHYIEKGEEITTKTKIDTTPVMTITRSRI